MLTLFAQELRQIPFVRNIIPFMAGIIVQLNFSVVPLILPAIIILFLLIITLRIVMAKNTYRRRFWIGLLIYLSIFISGAGLAKINTTKVPVFPKNETIIKARLIEPLTEKKNLLKTVLKIQFIGGKAIVGSDEAKILAYFQKDSSVNLTYGDEIIFKSFISELQNPGNPAEFDYKSYLLGKGITGQCYIEIEKYELTANNTGNKIIAFALRTRQLLSQIYRKHGIEGEELAVLSALTLGDKSELDFDTKEAYVKAGAMHILAVSGLHVGIIFVIINYLLSFLKKIKIGKYEIGNTLKAFTVILLLWFFALLTGFSPSVQRAAVMFTFIAIGNALNRRINIYNSLAASAFILLVYNPLLIKSVGFQLSYIAVISIVYIQPRLEKLITFKYNILHKIWVLTTVSIAAQIGTGPVSFMYFHIFPNWFALSNLIVIPLASIIVYNAGLLLAVSPIPYFSDVVAFFLKYSVKMLNGSVNFIEDLPASATENIPFELSDTLFWYMIIIGILIFFQYRQVKHLQITFGIITIYTAFLFIASLQLSGQQKMIVYNIRHASLLQFINNKEVINICDSTVESSKGYDFATKNHLLNSGITKSKFLNIDSQHIVGIPELFRKEEFMLFGNKKIVLLNKKEQSRKTSKTSIDTDCVILSGNEYFYIDDIQNLYNPDIIVFDSSNKQNRIQRWKEECDTLNQAYHSVPEQGAFILDCNSN